MELRECGIDEGQASESPVWLGTVASTLWVGSLEMEARQQNAVGGRVESWINHRPLEMDV